MYAYVLVYVHIYDYYRKTPLQSLDKYYFEGACVPHTPRACRGACFERMELHLTSGESLRAFHIPTLHLQLQRLLANVESSTANNGRHLGICYCSLEQAQTTKSLHLLVTLYTVMGLRTNDCIKHHQRIAFGNVLRSDGPGSQSLCKALPRNTFS